MNQKNDIPSSPLGERRGGLLLALLMLLFAIVISFVALLLPPPGVIDPSVLWVVAQALLFAASVCGLESVVQRLQGIARDSPREEGNK